MHFDTTISIGNIIMSGSFLIAAVLCWRDMDWRVKNLEIWRKEHMVDADSRDKIIEKLDRILDRIDWRLKLRLRDGEEEQG